MLFIYLPHLYRPHTDWRVPYHRYGDGGGARVMTNRAVAAAAVGVMLRVVDMDIQRFAFYASARSLAERIAQRSGIELIGLLPRRASRAKLGWRILRLRHLSRAAMK